MNTGARIVFFATATLTALVFAGVLAAVPEDQARAVLNQFGAATTAKDADAISRLLADDCVVIMTEPSGGAKRGRFFNRESYLKLLRERYSKIDRAAYNGSVQSVSAFESGDVFVTADSDVRARVDQRSEWIHSHDYIVMKPIGEKMMIRLIVTELAFYFPDVPPEPQNSRSR